MKNIAAIAIGAIIIVNAVNAQDRRRVLVLDFYVGEGTTQNHVSSLTSILTSFLQEEFEVVNSGEVDRIINELGFQQATMTDEQVEIVDSILNVEKVIFGSTRVEARRREYRLLAAVVNTETGTIRPVVGETGNIRGVNAFPRVAQRLAQNLMTEIKRSEVPVPQEIDVETLTRDADNRGVIINGVRWATSNVDTRHGTFAPSPEMAGRFNEWGVQSVWQGTWFLDRGVPIAAIHIAHGGGMNQNHWIRNNPCPPGWRVPYRDEFEALIAAGSFWTTVNGVAGRVFGTAPNQIFLPAAGGGGIDPRMDHIPTHVAHAGQIGYYWTRNRRGGASAYRLRFSQVDATVGVDGHLANIASGFSIRCVAQTNNIYIEF